MPNHTKNPLTAQVAGKKFNRILVLRRSSLGDIIHTFPAISEFSSHYPDCKIDWLVDQPFADLPRWLQPVDNIFAIDRRKLRNINKLMRGFYIPGDIKQRLKDNQYDAIVDLHFSQEGTVLASRLKRPFYGLGKDVLTRLKKNPDLARYYDHTLDIDSLIPGVYHERLEFVRFYRSIMALLGGYELSPDTCYKLNPDKLVTTANDEPTLIFMHSTSGDSKVWPLNYWQQLSRIATEAGYKVLLPWGDEGERARAVEIAAGIANCEVLPRLSIDAIVALIRDSSGLIGGDTGFTHVASLFNTPVVRIWGATFVGAAMPSTNSHDIISDYHCVPCMNLKSCAEISNGEGQYPPCYQEITAERVWKTFTAIQNRAKSGL